MCLCLQLNEKQTLTVANYFLKKLHFVIIVVNVISVHILVAVEGKFHWTGHDDNSSNIWHHCGNNEDIME